MKAHIQKWHIDLAYIRASNMILSGREDCLLGIQGFLASEVAQRHRSGPYGDNSAWWGNTNGFFKVWCAAASATAIAGI